MAQKKSYDFTNKHLYHKRIKEFVEKRLNNSLIREGAAIHFGAHQLIETKNVLLDLGFSPQRVYSLDWDKSSLEQAIELNESEHLGIPRKNFIYGEDCVVLEKIASGEIRLNGPLVYANLDYQGPISIRKKYTLALLFGKGLLKSGGFLGTNYLAGREGDSGQSFGRMIDDYEFIKNQVRRYAFSSQNEETESLMEARSEAISRFIQWLAVSGRSSLEITEDKRSFLRLKSDGRKLIEEYEQASNGFERFKVLSGYISIDEGFYPSIMSALKKEGYSDDISRNILFRDRALRLGSYFFGAIERGYYLSDVKNRMIYDFCTLLNLPKVPEMGNVALSFSESGNLIKRGIPNVNDFRIKDHRAVKKFVKNHRS
ncbi:hypothetical protein J4467_00375 [Candidatus Woesearchaeota archaeon]|nr:hypothetical protein [Candidatus Woesearchaeota archaeon]